MSNLQLIILGIGIVGFVISFVTQFMLRHHVSMERVREITDPAEIYKNCTPPKHVLTVKGQKIYKIFSSGFIMFGGSALAIILLDAGT